MVIITMTKPEMTITRKATMMVIKMATKTITKTITVINNLLGAETSLLKRSMACMTELGGVLLCFEQSNGLPLQRVS